MSTRRKCNDNDCADDDEDKDEDDDGDDGGDDENAGEGDLLQGDGGVAEKSHWSRTCGNVSSPGGFIVLVILKKKIMIKIMISMMMFLVKIMMKNHDN